MSSSPLFPLFADLRGRLVLVVGGGAVARRKAEALLDAGARVRVGAPELESDLAAWTEAGNIEHLRGSFQPDWLDSVWFVVAATNDLAVNRAVADAATERRLFANVVDDTELSSAQLPAVLRRGALQVAVSSAGAAPMLARALREKLETELDESLGALTELLAQWRGRIKRRLPDLAARRGFFSRVLAGAVPSLLRSGDTRAARRALVTELVASESRRRGRVALVGAGPGDAGLLTLRALRLLNEADVILYDRLVSADVLRLARRDAERIEVGKRVGGDHQATQDRIHALMLKHARDGKFVVRLKGGDPFVFGRGGEELEVLRAAGIGYEVVPGVTAALACAAFAGVPLTHREHAQSVRFITAMGSYKAGKDSTNSPDWSALAKERQTLAIYMGVAGLDELQRELIAHGRDPATPFALIENGSRREQRVVTGTLADLARRAQHHAVQSPALLILGEVAALANTLHWYGSPPLGAAATGPDGPASEIRGFGNKPLGEISNDTALAA